MLHYYDEIGLLKPSAVTDSGYRLYDDEALETLQQILFFNVWEEFKKENKDRVIKRWGSIDKFDEMIEQMKANETIIAENAIKLYGSIQNCAKAMKKDLNNDMLVTIGKGYDKFKEDFLEGKHPKLRELYKKLTLDLSKDPSSKEIQEIAKEITDTVKKDYEFFNIDEKGDNRWYHTMTKLDPKWTEAIHKNYGKLAADLSKDPASKEIQQIVEEIADTTKRNYKHYRIDTGINFKTFFSNMADIYLSSVNKDMNAEDKKYGNGAAKFIGESLKFYSENNK